MSTPTTISLMAAAAAIACGLLALRVSRVHGWRELRWFAVVAFLSAAYAAANLSAAFRWPTAVLIFCSHVQLAVAVLQHWAWMRYAEGVSRAAPAGPGRVLEALVLAAAALALVPGVAFDGTITYHAFDFWNVLYSDAHMRPAGFAIMALLPPVAVVVLVRFARARRRGIRYAGLQAAAYASVIAFSVNDALVSTGRFPLPYMLDIGFLLPVGLLAVASSMRFVETGQDLERLRDQLEALVEERTRALADTQEALVRAERLAALGQLANGVAHQVSSPAAVVSANLRFLAEHATPSAEFAEVVEDALASMQRINDLVRRLADAGRIASVSRAPTAVELAAVVERAVAEARERIPAHVTVHAAVPGGLSVRTRPEVLEQVMHSLLANAADALPPGRPGRIEISGERRAGGIRVTVTDDGVGMSPDVLERAFEPFFTTKPVGQGNGLGLPIARGIVEVHGGALWLESKPEHGTTAVLVLPETHQA